MSTVDNTKFRVSIVWGQDNDEQRPSTTYSFGSQKELDAFMLGVDEGVGWLEYTVVTLGGEIHGTQG